MYFWVFNTNLFGFLAQILLGFLTQICFGFNTNLFLILTPAGGRSSEGPRCRRLVVWIIVVISLPANPWLLRYILSFYIWQWHHNRRMGCFNVAISFFVCFFTSDMFLEYSSSFFHFECCCSVDFLLFFNFPLITQSHFCSLHFSHLSLAHNITHSSHHTLQKV